MDAALPVARTDIGNVAVSSVPWDPELLWALAMKEAEIIIRTSTGGYRRADMEAICRANSMYEATVDNFVSPGTPAL